MRRSLLALVIVCLLVLGLGHVYGGLGAGGLCGSVDDTANIQPLLDHGGTVTLPAGTCSVHGLLLSTGTVLRGAGYGATTLRAAPGFSGDLVQTVGYTNLAGTDQPGGPTTWELAELTLDGAGTASWCLRVYGSGFTLSDLHIRNCTLGGVSSEWSTWMPALGDGMEAVVRNLEVHDTPVGIDWLGPHDSQWSDVRVHDTTTRGVHLGPAATGTQILNLHVYHPGQTAVVTEGWGSLLSDCQIEGASQVQLTILAANTRVSNCHLYGFPATIGASVCLQLGDAVHAVAGVWVDALMENCTAGSVVFSNDTGLGRIAGLLWQTSGPYTTGTKSASMDISGLMLSGH